ncbi:MAG: aspartate aminotransferase family protein, partial [Chitinophagales bacterium]
GILGIGKLPIIYCSQESHHSIAKAAKATGLGTQAVRSIAVNEALQINTELLQEQIKKDRQNGHQPFMVIGTAGTTGVGAIDDLEALYQITNQENLWFHVDAAYGGAAVISQKYKSHLAGIQLSDSITLDIHKWFSVPMGASLFLTKKTNILHQSFGIKTKYMPKDGDATVVTDPYTHSIQWSRRFIGLKTYLPIAIYGWKGYEETIDHQIEMGNLLRDLLREKGWAIKNDTHLPIVCFTHPDFKSNPDAASNLVEKVVNSGKAWFSVYPIAGETTLRVCITNYATTSIEVQELVDLLEEYR